MASYPLRLEYLRKEETNKLRERERDREREKEKKERIPLTMTFKQMRHLYTSACIILKSFLLESVTQSILIHTVPYLLFIVKKFPIGDATLALNACEALFYVRS
jgi:hypothetical protein